MSRPPLYVGVAGIATRAQTDAVLAALPLGFPRRVALGVLASAKTLAGGACNARSPAPRDIAGIFLDDDRAYNLIHYFSHTQGEGLDDELTAALNIAGRDCHGIQINIPWPSSSEVESFADRWHTDIVLQIGPKALDAAKWSIPQIVRRLRSYRFNITHVLLDASGGTGRTFEAFAIADLVAAVRESYPNLGIVVAGGFTPHHLPDPALLGGVSIDAESGVRDHSDALDPGKVRAFFDGISGLLGEAVSP